MSFLRRTIYLAVAGLCISLAACGALSSTPVSQTAAETAIAGDVLERLGMPAKAMAAWRTAAADSSLADEQRITLARNLWLGGDEASAQKTLNSIILHNPKAADALHLLGTFTASVDPIKATDFFNRAARADPVYQVEQKQWQQMVSALQKSSDPAYQKVVVGQTLAGMSEWQQALRVFQQAAGLEPGYAEAWAYVGEALEQTGKDGWPSIQKALGLSPKSDIARSIAALYYQAHNQPLQALHYLQDLAADHPDGPSWQVEIATAYAQDGDMAKALDALDQAQSKGPDNPTVLRGVAVFCVTYSTQLRERGLPAARHLLALQPESADALDVMGWVLLNLGDTDSAERFFLKAVERDGSNTSAHFHLGALYLRRGDFAEAVRQLAQARELAGSSAPVAEWNSRLLGQVFHTGN